MFCSCRERRLFAFLAEVVCRRPNFYPKATPWYANLWRTDEKWIGSICGNSFLRTKFNFMFFFPQKFYSGCNIDASWRLIQVYEQS